MSRTHEELAFENYRDASRATTTEWGITMLFYAAVHAADHAMFPGGAPEQSYDHQQREKSIRQSQRLKTIERQYTELKMMSKFARYCPAKHPMTPEKQKHAEYLAKHILARAGLTIPESAAPTPDKPSGTAVAPLTQA